jgi:hypothetical protein
MNAQRPPPSTAASTTLAPKPPPPRIARQGAPFTPFAPEGAPLATPEGASPPLEALAASGSLARDRFPLDALLAAVPPTASASRTPPPEATTDPKSPHADASPADPSEPRDRPHLHDDPLDPMLRQPALLAPTLPAPLAASRSPEAAVAMQASASLEELLPQLVRRIAWSGDGKKGTVRMELGAGVLAGATLMLESEGGRVRVQLDAPAGVDGQAWKERIGARLAEKRIEVESIEVR